MVSVNIHSTNLENIVAGSLEIKFSARGDRILRYYIDVRHTKLNIHKEVSAPEVFILQSKLDALMASWDEKYESYQLRNSLWNKQTSADQLSADSARKLAALGKILERTLGVDDRVNWDGLKDKSKFTKPKEFPEPKPVSSPAVRPAFDPPKVTFLQSLLGKKAAILAAAQEEYFESDAAWQRAEAQRQNDFDEAQKGWEKRRKAFWDSHKAKEEAFIAAQLASHATVDRLAAAVESGDEDAVIEHASLVLDRSDYDGLFEKTYLIQYDRSRRLMKVAYDLPSIDILPTVKLVKFVKATGELKESFITDKEKKANFESVAYQVCLRTIHELFEADVSENIDAVLFNGFVDFIDPATGLQKRSLLLSLLVDRATFFSIDLGRVHPKACFKSLKGVSAA